jgi:hypothetical protein
MELETVTFNGTQPTFEKVIKKILTQWGELPHAFGEIRTVGGWTDERQKYEDKLQEERQRAIAAGEVATRSTAEINVRVYPDDEIKVRFYLYTDEPAPPVFTQPIFVQVEYGRLDTTIAPYDRTYVTVTAHEPLVAEMCKQWARLKDYLISERWIAPQIMQAVESIEVDEEQRRIAQIRAMDWQNMSDYQIGQRLYVGESRAKQLRLRGGMKRKERTKTLS